MQAIDAGYALLEQGRSEQAESLARSRLAAAPRQPAWLQLLALSLAQQSRADEAAAAFQTLTTLEPAEPAHWLNLGNARLALQAADEALAAFAHARALGGSGIACDLGYGLALLACGRPGEALAPLRAAAASGAVDARLAYACCLCEREAFEDADAAVASLDPDTLAAADAETLAWIYAQCGRDAEAERLFRTLLDAAPERAELRVRYALLLERLNRLDDARAQLAHPAVAAAPPMFNAGLVRARLLRRARDYAGALAALDTAADSTRDPAALAALAFERGKVHDLAGDCAGTMTALAQAHARAEDALAARFGRSAPGHDLAWLQDRLTAPAPDDWRETIDDGLPRDPAFLVGFPRSGTTLLENVLDSHPGLDSLDERPALEQAIARAHADGYADAEALRRLPRPMLHALRRDYWQAVARYLPAPAQGRLLDKYPLHLTRAAYIARLFPRADIVLLLRHPCDCVLSCYLQSFGMNGGVLSFSTLDSAARTYAEIMGYWEQQRQRIATPVHVLRYEDLVQAFESETAQVLDFLGLGWHAAVADYRSAVADRGQRIRTPSYSQVVEPLHRGAVARWRRYRAYFSDTALALLQPFVAHYGYTLD